MEKFSPHNVIYKDKLPYLSISFDLTKVEIERSTQAIKNNPPNSLGHSLTAQYIFALIKNELALLSKYEPHNTNAVNVIRKNIQNDISSNISRMINIFAKSYCHADKIRIIDFVIHIIYHNQKIQSNKVYELEFQVPLKKKDS